MYLSPKFRRNLEVQGFACSTTGFKAIEPWLRLNPSACLILAVVGLAFKSPTVFLVMAAFAAFGAIFKHAPLDLVYNYGIRYLTHTPSLPVNPPPRRFACFIGFLWSLTIAWAFFTGSMTLAYTLAIVLILVIIPMVAIHYCVASEIYQKIIGYRPK